MQIIDILKLHFALVRHRIRVPITLQKKSPFKQSLSHIFKRPIKESPFRLTIALEIVKIQTCNSL